MSNKSKFNYLQLQIKFETNILLLDLKQYFIPKHTKKELIQRMKIKMKLNTLKVH